jgi:hypothetical protein
VEDLGAPSVFWLNGLVGTGKSTIARTVAERCFAKGKLGASFFSHRRTHDGPRVLFPALAFQLAQKYTQIRSILVDYLRSNPKAGFGPLKDQAEKLVAAPLRSANIATVVVIDALDEHMDNREILRALEIIVDQAPKVKFFITSRPGPLIECGFHGPKHISALNDTMTRCLIDNDIRVFLKHELSALAVRNGLDNWPTGELLDTLHGRVDGLFAYAVATVKFLDNWSPPRRCNTITKDPRNTIYERTVEGVHGGLSLDSLCISILQMSFKKNTTEEDEIVRLVLEAALFAQSPPCTIPENVQRRTGEVVTMAEVTGILRLMSALLELHKNNDNPARPFHRLFCDFLTDQDRCPKQFLVSKYHVNPNL